MSDTGEDRPPPEAAVLGLEAGIVTPAADDLARFYRAAFGFEIAARFELPQGVVVRLRAGRTALKLFEPAGGVQAGERADPWHRDAGFAYGALHVGDVGTAHRRALDHGAASLAAPTRHRPGARYALVADPEGNVWELLEEEPG